MRLEDHAGFAIFRDPEGVFSARKIEGEATRTNAWPFSEVFYAARTLEEIYTKIDTNAPEDA